MKQFFENKKNCVSVIDIYSMTKSLMKPKIIDQAKRLILDSMHTYIGYGT
jgi:hypothetical protein